MSTKEYFNRASNTWDKKFSTPELASFLAKFVPQFNLKSGQNILDVGTGTGVIIPYLIRAIGPSGAVIAIDYSEKMVQICKTKYSHLKNVSIKVGNIEEDAFPAESFEAVTCFGVFPHIENKQKALLNINNLLKPGGKLVIAHALGREELNVHHKKVSKQVEHAMLSEKAEMTKLLEQAEFTRISIKDEPGCYLCITHKL